MASQQGDLSLLDSPIAQALLHSTNPARLAYVWPGGTPRVVPIWFHWTGKEVVLGTPSAAPKIKALRRNPKVALTIDSADYRVLLIRGTARIELMDGVVPEYAMAARRYMGEEEGNAWLQQASTLMKKMARIAIEPEWVGTLDFQTRFPSAIEAAMAGA